MLARGAVAHPNARSGHRRPTPQGAGLAVIPVALIGAGVAAVALGAPNAILPHALAVAAACLLLMGLGFLDDRRPLPVMPRLLLQVVAAILVAASLPADFRLSPLPPLIERPLLVLTILWAVNLTNFMDGMDWLAGSEAIAICLGIVVLGATGFAPAWLAGVSAALLGAVAGFMPANAPVARVFLGDAGSLPLGLALCVLLLHLAERGAPAAAAILPLYFVADATLTLALRSFRGEPLWVAHRDHWLAAPRRLAQPANGCRAIGKACGQV